MSKWNRKLGKILTALGICAAVCAASPGMPITASAATAVTDGVMIRNDATTEAGIIGSLNEGDEVEILDVLQSGDGYAWYYIQLGNGNTGYVRSDLISADDSELAAFRDEAPAEEAKEEPAEAAEEKPAEEQPAEEQPAPEQSEAQAPDEGATVENVQTSEAAAAAAEEEGYDAVKDPSASFSVKYETDATGSGSWYAYNDDNGSRYLIQREDAGTASKDSGTGNPGIWKPLAIVFGIIAAALLAFVLFLIKSIRDGRNKSSRRRAAAIRENENEEDEDEDEEEEEEEEEEFFFEDDSDDDAADPAEDVPNRDSTLSVAVPEETKPAEISAEQVEEALAGDADSREENVPESVPAEAEEPAAAAEAEPAEVKDTPAEEPKSEEAEPVPEAEPEVEPEPAEAQKAKEEPVQPVSNPVPAEELDSWDEKNEEEPAEPAEEDRAGEEDEEDFEDYDDEDYDDEDFDDDEDDDYENDEDEEPSRSRVRSAAGSGKGGRFMGFLRKIFGSDHPEDADDDEDFDDYDDEPAEREFDEFKDYPEDIDLLPREDVPEEDDLQQEPETDPGLRDNDGERGRLTMQRVMKNVDYREEEADFSQTDNPDDLSDSLYDDDDDMEYSFISNTKRK